MIIYLGADHGGFALKEHLKEFVKNLGYEIVDCGAEKLDPADDYVDYAKKVAESVGADPTVRKGIVVCRSGAGVDIVANKFDGVRSVLGFDSNQVYDSRRDDDVNVLALSAEELQPEDAEKLTRLFLGTPFAGEERFQRRLDKIKDIEKGN